MSYWSIGRESCGIDFPDRFISAYFCTRTFQHVSPVKELNLEFSSVAEHGGGCDKRRKNNCKSIHVHVQSIHQECLLDRKKKLNFFTWLTFSFLLCLSVFPAPSSIAYT